MSSRLFREEALRFAGQQTLGEVIVTQPLSLKLLTGLIGSLVSAASLFLWLGEYSRKETVQGYLEPQTGLVNVYARTSGASIAAVHVSVGDLVRAGDTLLELKSNTVTAQGVDSFAELISELQNQRQQLETQLTLNDTFYAQESKRLRERVVELEAETRQQQEFLKLQQERVKLIDRLLGSMAPLRRSGAIPEVQWLQTVSNQLEQQKEVVVIEQRLLQLDSERKSVLHELDQLPSRAESQQLETRVQLSSIEQRLVEVQARQDEQLIAPIDGIVSSVQAQAGEAVSTNQPLMTLLPDDASLECVLLLPTSAVGFVEQGQTIRLKFDAFPHQQFGTFPATLLWVSQSTIAPRDLRAPVRAHAPVYIARAALDTNVINVRNQRRSLQPGMLLSADIVLERRSLLDWLLEPLYSVRGRSN